MNLPALPPAAIELKPQTVVIVTALDVETKAVLRHLGNDWTDETVQGTVFYRGTFEGWNVAVVEAGRIVEIEPTTALFSTPKQPATRRLLGREISSENYDKT